MMRRRPSGAALSSVLLLAACGADDAGSSRRQDGAKDAATESGARDDAAGSELDARGIAHDGGGPLRCPEGLEGPVLVLVQAPLDAPVSAYCIDSTEVTSGQYAAFLSKGFAKQDPWCEGNTSFEPGSAAAGPDYPEMGADWCDAFAYCRWAGKHLCGKITAKPEGERLGPADYANPAASEWFNACSAGGTRAYPYGDTFDPSACKTQPDIDPTTAAAAPVGSLATCEGGVPGVFDLAGNVAEWENTCSDFTGSTDYCATRGGMFVSGNADTQRCDKVNPAQRSFAVAPLGFRCCASAIR